MKLRLFSSHILYLLGVILLSQTNTTQAQALATCLNQDLEDGGEMGNPDPPSLSIQNIATEKADFLLMLEANWKHAFTFCPTLYSWTNIESNLDISFGSNGAFGGMNATIQGNQLRFAITTYEDPEDGPQEEVDFNKLAHAFTFSGGLQTDAEFQNLSFLVETGYAPVYLGLPWLKIGTSIGNTSWIRAGVFFQGGYTINIDSATEVNSTQANEEVVDSTGVLLRFKTGGSSNVYLPVNTSDIKAFRFLPEAWLWYDVLSNQFHGLVEGNLRLDITDNVSYDILRLKHGNPPPDFAPGTQFSTGLTIRF